MDRTKELLLSLAAPPSHRCYLCEEEEVLGEDGLCDACRRALKLAISPAPPEGLDGLSAGLQYCDELGTIFYRFKKMERRDYTPFLAQFISIPEEWHAELLLPVPLHWWREYRRTYNQSFLLSEYVSSRYGIPICRDLLVRTRPTPQQKKLPGKQRRRHLKGAFRAAPECQGRSIVLIDDVVTTGSTLSECARTLKKAGAYRVYAACVACTER